MKKMEKKKKKKQKQTLTDTDTETEKCHHKNPYRNCQFEFELVSPSDSNQLSYELKRNVNLKFTGGAWCRATLARGVSACVERRASEDFA